jgi:ABC-2 type transport system ATP-binding protein
VGKTYGGTVALVDLTLTVPPGAIFGLLGPNGAGKTTVVGICSTLVGVSRGEVRVGGISPMDEPKLVKELVGLVPQLNTLDGDLSVEQNLRLHCRYFGLGRREAARRTEEVAEQFGFVDRLASSPAELSGGLIQRVKLARAVSHEPAILFLDEPTTGLDPEGRHDLWMVVRELQSDGRTIVVTTHFLEEAEEMCDHVAVIDRGRLLADGRPESLRLASSALSAVAVEVQGDAGALAAELDQFDDVVAVKRDLQHVHATGRDASSLAARVATTAARFSLVQMEVSQPSLEAVFMEIVAKEGSDGSAGSAPDSL